MQKAEKKLKKAKKKLQNSAELIAQLQAELEQRNAQIDGLQQQLACLSEARSTTKQTPQAKAPRSDEGLKRQDWKRFSFLRDRYEFHLTKQSKPKARLSANQDLIEAFGETSGYSPDELECILS
ncbi:MAG: hypothetical protein HQL47_05780 [Gammaproteobacteria bacterium]|nr:hypothetical protein [Gammaproteobacteria bacterium]